VTIDRRSSAVFPSDVEAAPCTTPGKPREVTMEPRLKAVPKISDVRNLIELSPGVEDVDPSLGTDGFDSTTERYRYGFFRDAEFASFITSTDRFQALNGWYLSDAAFLAYANRPTAAEVVAQITPPLKRLFRTIPSASGGPPREPVVKVILRDATLVPGVRGIKDPLQCYVVDNGEVGIVSFRGTLPTSLTNWLTDFEANMVSWSGGDVRVHQGFSVATDLLLSDNGPDDPGLRSYLAERLRKSGEGRAAPALKLWFTGHSLGAAISTLAAYAIGNVQALYTFGSPRVGNLAFAQAFASSDIPHYRVVHHQDIVPHVPFALPLIGYEHVGDLKYLEYEDDGAYPDPEIAPAAANAPSNANPTSKLYDGLALEAQLAGEFENLFRSWFDVCGRIKIGFLAEPITPLTDHAPLYYSDLLWNSFVKERARLLGPTSAG
jgi:hypothetical protein